LVVFIINRACKLCVSYIRINHANLIIILHKVYVNLCDYVNKPEDGVVYDPRSYILAVSMWFRTHMQNLICYN